MRVRMRVVVWDEGIEGQVGGHHLKIYSGHNDRE
jgi:hypothetical protein